MAEEAQLVLHICLDMVLLEGKALVLDAVMYFRWMIRTMLEVRICKFYVFCYTTSI
ncbi:hypothetical protein V6Z12_D05G271000 [Gossypium hirsutum]